MNGAGTSNAVARSNGTSIEELRKQVDALQSNQEKFGKRVDRELHGIKGRRADQDPGLNKRVADLEERHGIEPRKPAKKKGNRKKPQKLEDKVNANSEAIEELKNKVEELDEGLDSRLQNSLIKAAGTKEFLEAIRGASGGKGSGKDDMNDTTTE